MTASRRMLMTGASLGLLLSVVVVVAPVWAEGYEVTRDVEFARPGGIPLKCDVYRPEGDGPFPTVLCVHGGAWFAGTRGQLTHVAVALAQSGYAAVSVDKSGGSASRPVRLPCSASCPQSGSRYTRLLQRCPWLLSSGSSP